MLPYVTSRDFPPLVPSFVAKASIGASPVFKPNLIYFDLILQDLKLDACFSAAVTAVEKKAVSELVRENQGRESTISDVSNRLLLFGAYR